MTKGERFITTSGEYSDFNVGGTFVALADFDFDAELIKWGKTNPKYAEGRFEPFLFLRDLMLLGLIEDEPVLSIHLGDYGFAPERPEARARESLKRYCDDR